MDCQAPPLVADLRLLKQRLRGCLLVITANGHTQDPITTRARMLAHHGATRRLELRADAT